MLNTLSAYQHSLQFMLYRVTQQELTQYFLYARQELHVKIKDTHNDSQSTVTAIGCSWFKKSAKSGTLTLYATQKLFWEINGSDMDPQYIE